MSPEQVGRECIHAQFLLQYGSLHERFELRTDLRIPSRGVTAIFGHSGSGKTTFLQLLAGLKQPSEGRLTINGTVWQDADSFLPPHKRAVGYVFQDAGLLPHLSAEKNLAYARTRAGAGPFTSEYEHIVKLMGIGALLRRYPHQLSGGEKQRVAIARALLTNPAVLLMDEPLASLDPPRKQEILPYLERLRDEFALPILYVSHAIDEVSRLADHVVVLESGSVIAEGDIQSVFSRLDLPLRLGDDTGVVIAATVVERDPQWHLAKVRFAGGELWVRDAGDVLGTAVRIRILARDVSLALSAQADSSIINKLGGVVSELLPGNDAAVMMVKVNIGDTALVAQVTCKSADRLQLHQGNRVWVQVKSAAVVR